MQETVRKFGFGRAAYHAFFRPLGWVRRRRRQGWYFGAIQGRSRSYVKALVQKLPAQPCTNIHGTPVHLLTGRWHWYMTAFAAHSFIRHHVAAGPLFIHSDGTLGSNHTELLLKALPDATIITENEVTTRLDVDLPRGRFPTLRDHRLVFPLLRKLTDTHAGRDGWCLFLDSDTLTHSTSRFMENWLTAPTRSIFQQDHQNSYGNVANPELLMTRLVERPIPFGVNSGVCGLRSDGIDWDRVESWATLLLSEHGPSHFLEQALTAMIITAQNPEPIPVAECALIRVRDDLRMCQAAIRHYLTDSRPAYLGSEIRKYFESQSGELA